MWPQSVQLGSLLCPSLTHSKDQGLDLSHLSSAHPVTAVPRELVKGTAVFQTPVLPLPQWSGGPNKIPCTGPPLRLKAEPYGLAAVSRRTQTV